jgi:hypothetical protein
MKKIVTSIILNLIGLAIILGNLAKLITHYHVNNNLYYLGLLSILISLSILLIYSSEFKKIKGTLLSSKISIISKFQVSVVFVCLTYFILMVGIIKFYLYKDVDTAFLYNSIIISILSALHAFIFLRIKQIKYDDAFVYISNFIKTEKIPLSQVKKLQNHFFLIYGLKKLYYVDNNYVNKNAIFFIDLNIVTLFYNNKSQKFKNLIVQKT